MKNSQNLFESSINHCSFKFKNPRVEAEYLADRINFKFLSARSRFFIYVVGIGTFLVYFLDTMAVIVSSSYNYNFDTLVSISLILPITIIEIICYKSTRFTKFRGVAVTVIGTFIQFIRNYASFADDAFYPFIGTE